MKSKWLQESKMVENISDYNANRAYWWETIICNSTKDF